MPHAKIAPSPARSRHLNRLSQKRPRQRSSPLLRLAMCSQRAPMKNETLANRRRNWSTRRGSAISIAIRTSANSLIVVCQVPWASQTNSSVATSRRSPRKQGWCCLVLESDRMPPQNSCVPDLDPRVFDDSRQTTRKCRVSEDVNVLLPNAVVDWVGDAVGPGNRTDKSQIIRACVRWKTVNRA